MCNTTSIDIYAGAAPALDYCGSLSLNYLLGSLPLLAKSIPTYLYGRSRICLFFPDQEDEILKNLINLLKSGVCLVSRQTSVEGIVNILRDYGGMKYPNVDDSRFSENCSASEKVKSDGEEIKSKKLMETQKEGEKMVSSLKKKLAEERRLKKKSENICHECGKSFWYPSLLKNHQAVSHGEYKKMRKFIQVTCRVYTYIF